MPEFEAILEALACRLHEQDGKALTTALEPGTLLGAQLPAGVAVEGDTLGFASLADRNRIVAHSMLRKLGPGISDGERLFEAAYKLWRHEIGHDDQASGRFLAIASEQVDVLRLAADRIVATQDVFRVLHVIESMLSHASELPLNSLLTLTSVQHERTKNDLAGGELFIGIERWLSPRPHVAKELVDTILASPAPALANLLGAAWMAWFSTDPSAAGASVLESGVDPRDPLPAVTPWICGRMLSEPSIPKDLKARLESLILERLRSTDQTTRRASLSAAANLLPINRSFDFALRELAQSNDQDALANIATALARHARALLDAGLFFEWLKLCASLNAESSGALRYIDGVLARHLTAGSKHSGGVLEFLRSWVLSQPYSGPHDRRLLESFQSCCGRLVEQQALCDRVITEWFLEDGLKLVSAATALLSGFRRPGVRSDSRFDVGTLNAAADGDLLFLARRLIGYVIDVDQLLPLALSLLAVHEAPRRIYPMLTSLLGDEIGYDFPGTTIKYLKQAEETSDDAAAKDILRAIREGLERYMAILNQLAQQKEFAAPIALRRAFARARAKGMERSMREADSKSVLRQLVTQVHIKGGRSNFQYLGDSYTEPLILKEISVSFQLPRREALDPVGNTFRLRSMRNASRVVDS